MKLDARRVRAGRSWSSAALLVAVVGGALVVALLAMGGSTRPDRTDGASAKPPATGPVEPVVVPPAGGSSFTLMQMNLCLSGMSGCYGLVAYPAVLDEAADRIREERPDAVTFNETCRRDIARLARRTGYHLRFTRVIYAGARLPCIDPGGRGLFGDAVLTRAPVKAAESRAFATQSGLEERRWLCVTTRRGVDVCTAHLSTRGTGTSRATNDAQCTELGALLAHRAAVRTVVFGGDVNRVGSCAPHGVWTRTDGAAAQTPGLQHAYGSARTLRSSTAEVLPAAHSDHDVLIVHARLVSH